MSITRWLRNLRFVSRQAKKPGPGSRPRHCRPQLECLEGRVVPSTLVVNSTADSGTGSLRAEIAAASSGDTIQFDSSLANQTITLKSALVINKSLDIENPYAANLTLSGNNASRVFDITNSATVTLANLTIANGLAQDSGGGGIENETGSTLFLNNDTLKNNTAYGIGGGLWNQIGAAVHVSDSTFTGNKAIGSLTFVYAAEAFAAGSGTTEGGGIDNDGSATVTATTFTNNVAQGITGSNGTGGGAQGGGLVSDGDLSLSGGSFSGNRAIGGNGAAGGKSGPGGIGGTGGEAAGGAMSIDGPLTTANVSSTFTNNSAIGGNGGTGSNGHNGGTGGAGAGGALSMADGTLTLSDSLFSGNSATGGIGGTGGKNGDGGAGGIGRGGAFVHTVTFGTSTPLSNLDHVTMSDNHATGGVGGNGGYGGNGGIGGAGQGGAIRALLGTINVDNSQLDDNFATGGTGGVAGVGGVGGNGGNGQGGALFTTFGVKAALTNTELMYNQALGGAGATGGNGGNGLGGAIFNDGPSPYGTPSLTLVGCTIEFNQADGGAAGAGGSEGAGIGGGIYNLGELLVDNGTVVNDNDATTSNDDIYP